MGRRSVAGSSAFEDLFRAEFVPLVRALTLFAGDGQSAADAVQDAFVQAHRHWSKVSRLERPEAWVRHTAINRVRNQHRGRVRQLAALPRMVADEAVPAPDHDRSDLARALAELPEQQRQAIVLYYLLDASTADIAKALGTTEATVRSHVRHARDRIQANLGKETP